MTGPRRIGQPDTRAMIRGASGGVSRHQLGTPTQGEPAASDLATSSVVESLLARIVEQNDDLLRRLGAPPVRLHTTTLGNNTVAGAAALLGPGQEALLVAHDFWGLVIFLSLSSTSKDILVTINLDGNLHEFPIADAVDGSFSIPHFPGILVMEDDPVTPLFVLAFTPGDSFGFPFSGSFRYTIRNVASSGTAVILKTIVRVQEPVRQPTTRN